MCSLRHIIFIIITYSHCQASSTNNKLISTAYELQKTEYQIYLLKTQKKNLMQRMVDVNYDLYKHYNTIAMRAKTLRQCFTNSPFLVLFTNMTLPDLIHHYITMQSISPDIIQKNTKIIGQIDQLKQLKQQNYQLTQKINQLDVNKEKILKKFTTALANKSLYEADILSKESLNIKELKSLIAKLKPTNLNANNNREIFFNSPVMGQIKQTKHNGVMIKTYNNALITSPTAGHIVSIKHSEKYGGVVIIFNQGNFFILCGFNSVLCKEGDNVEAGYPLGRLGNTLNYHFNNSSNLLVMVYQDGYIVNPIKYCKELCVL